MYFVMELGNIVVKEKISYGFCDSTDERIAFQQRRRKFLYHKFYDEILISGIEPTFYVLTESKLNYELQSDIEECA